MRTSLQCCVLTLLALDILALGTLAVRGWPTRLVRSGANWIPERVPMTATDYQIVGVIILAHLVCGYFYFRHRSPRS
jgi:hypothetical protein